MGITGYHKWMKQTHPGAFKDKWLDTYDHLYIDLNFALHWAHYGAKTTGAILGKLFAFLDKIIFKVYPTKSITIANDGPAPIAKLLLQRSRRSGAAREIENIETSSLIFTPGTEFMNSIQSSLEKYMEKIKLVYNVEANYMLGCEGEAELKLKKKIMDNIAQNSEDTHIIISNDADIVAMFGTFNIKSFFNVFVFCDLRINKEEIMSLGVLLEAHTSKYGLSRNFGKDFTFISIMLGNDYLPKVSFVDLDKLWDAYCLWVDQYKDGIIINDKLDINIPFMIQILETVISRTKNHLISRFDLDQYKPPVYQNYMEGLLWCMNMYNIGYCHCYKYMYEFQDETPHPLGLICNLFGNPEIAKFKDVRSPSINPDLYAILVFPRKAIKLINKKYHDFAENCDILHEEEDCKLCQEFYNQLALLNFKEKEYKEISKELKLHKKQHSRIVADDICEIVKDFSKEFKLKNKILVK